MIQIAICDDEKEILDEVSGYIKDYAEKKDDLETYSSGNEFEERRRMLLEG